MALPSVVITVTMLYLDGVELRSSSAGQLLLLHPSATNMNLYTINVDRHAAEDGKTLRYLSFYTSAGWQTKESQAGSATTPGFDGSSLFLVSSNGWTPSFKDIELIVRGQAYSGSARPWHGRPYSPTLLP